MVTFTFDLFDKHRSSSKYEENSRKSESPVTHKAVDSAPTDKSKNQKHYLLFVFDGCCLP